MRPTPYMTMDGEIKAWNGAYEWAMDSVTGEIIGVWHTGW